MQHSFIFIGSHNQREGWPLQLTPFLFFLPLSFNFLITIVCTSNTAGVPNSSSQHTVFTEHSSQHTVITHGTQLSHTAHSSHKAQLSAHSDVLALCTALVPTACSFASFSCNSKQGVLEHAVHHALVISPTMHSHSHTHTHAHTHTGLWLPGR
jgi:hypothetical protein